MDVEGVWVSDGLHQHITNFAHVGVTGTPIGTVQFLMQWLESLPGFLNFEAGRTLVLHERYILDNLTDVRCILVCSQYLHHIGAARVTLLITVIYLLLESLYLVSIHFSHSDQFKASRAWSLIQG